VAAEVAAKETSVECTGKASHEPKVQWRPWQERAPKVTHEPADGTAASLGGTNCSQWCTERRATDSSWGGSGSTAPTEGRPTGEDEDDLAPDDAAAQLRRWWR
jgi:hypothetical protein